MKWDNDGPSLSYKNTSVSTFLEPTTHLKAEALSPWEVE